MTAVLQVERLQNCGTNFKLDHVNSKGKVVLVLNLTKHSQRTHSELDDGKHSLNLICSGRISQLRGIGAIPVFVCRE
jgi:hypothetical protein